MGKVRPLDDYEPLIKLMCSASKISALGRERARAISPSCPKTTAALAIATYHHARHRDQFLPGALDYGRL
jgi:hypothetical protein